MCNIVAYRKIPKISPGAYIFQRPFLRDLFLDGLIYIRRGLSTEGKLRFKIDWASLIAGGCQEACRSLTDGSARPTE